MLKGYLTIALRNIRQKPVFALINIFSLAIGIASCIAIYLFIQDERSFDAWHSKKNSLYRLDENQNFTGTIFQKVALTGGPMGPVMHEAFPEVVNFTRYWGRAKQVLKLGEKQFLVDKVAAVDTSFLTLFDYELVHGDRSTVLDEPSTMVLTEKTARKFFDDPADAIGKTITKRDWEFKITGILKDVPENSHLQFDALESFGTYTKEDSTININWNGNYLVTYLQLGPNVDAGKLEAKFHDWFIKWTGNPTINDNTSLYLQRFTDVHLGSSDMEHDYQNYRRFDGTYLKIFFITGIFILLIAAVNFMNLTIARASYRWKEIGVRTSIGARKIQLFNQFIIESIGLTMLAFLLALLLDALFIPLLNQLVGRRLDMMVLVTDPSTLLVALSGVFALGLLTGLYPSIYMTAANTVGVLKGVRVQGKSAFRSGLVVLQFGLAIAMMVSTMIVVRQLYFMKNKDVGFSASQMLLVQLDRESNKNYKVMKTELLQKSQVLGVTASGQRLGNNFHQWGMKIKADTGVTRFTPSNVNVDYDYLKVYGLRLKEGRGFEKDGVTDHGKGFIVNEAFVKQLDLKNPVGTQVGHGWYNNDSLGSIIGVVKDFNFNSLHHAINTLSIVCHQDWGFDEMSVKVNGANLTESIAAVKTVWDKHVTGFPFTYTFLDEHMAGLYRTEQQMSAITTIMAVLAILISCMGLFGLALITTEKKTKEIGIRKVLGATEGQITMLLSGQFARLILVSFVIASPLTYFALSRWLETFAFRVGIDPLYFVAGGAAALVVALLTIGYHTLQSARANPARALRYE